MKKLVWKDDWHCGFLSEILRTMYYSEGQVDKWRDCWSFVNVLKKVKFSHVFAIKLYSYLLFDKIPETHWVTFSTSNTDCWRYVKRFALLLYQLTDLRLPNYNSHSTQHAAVSQPDMNKLAATKFPRRSANDLQSGDCTTAGRITQRTVRWCSSVIIRQQFIYCLLLIGTSLQISPSNRPWRPRGRVVL